MTDKKQIHIAGKISSSQDGVVVYTDGCVPCHTAGRQLPESAAYLRPADKILT